MLKDKLNKDLIQALKNKDSLRVDTLRLLNSAIHNKELDKRSANNGEDIALTDDEVLGVLRSEAKKRKEAILLYQKGNREDLAKKEEEELKIIEEYLPSQLSDEEVKKIVDEVFFELKPLGLADFGKVVGAAMKRTGGRASGDRVAKAVREKLGDKQSL